MEVVDKRPAKDGLTDLKKQERSNKNNRPLKNFKILTYITTENVGQSRRQRTVACQNRDIERVLLQRRLKTFFQSTSFQSLTHLLHKRPMAAKSAE